ncbi:MAG: C25 family cysteine peptidase [Candidatus Hatepunaea meridiana]|nr:C25 family cysteine peptidase [Candidatus Hatepunaea meridiana]
MSKKTILLLAFIIFLTLTLFNQGYTTTRPTGLSTGSNEFAQILSQSGTDLHIRFTPPASHKRLLDEITASQNQNITNLAYTYWLVVPPMDHVELEIVEQNGRRLSISDRDAPDPYIDREDVKIQTDKYYPPAPVIMGKPQIMRGIRMVPITVFPIQLLQESSQAGTPVSPDGIQKSQHHNITTSQHQIAVENSQIEIKLNFTNDEAINPLLNSAPRQMSHSFANIINSYTLNPPPHLIPRRDLAATELAKSLILYPQVFDDNEDAAEAMIWLNHLVHWKRRQGYYVELAAVEVDRENEDNSDDIKDLIGDYYEDGFEFVTLIGNEDYDELNTVEGNNTELYFPSWMFIIRVVQDTLGNDVIIRGYREHEYSLLEGDDEMPDIIISRIKVPTYDRLVGALRKTIAYQIDPYLDNDNDWYSHSLVTIEEDSIGIIVLSPEYLSLAYWEQARLTQKGYNDIDVILGPVGSFEDGVYVGDDIKEVLEEGVSLALGEGWLYDCVAHRNWEQWEDYAETGRMHPFVIANLSYYEQQVMYPFYASGTSDNLNGPIAGLGIYDTGGRSVYMTHIIGSALMAMTMNDVYTPGHLQIITKMYLSGLIDSVRIYEEDPEEAYISGIITALRLHWTLGDPTVDVFSEFPVQITVDHPESYLIGETSIILNVIDDNDNNVADANVCIYQEDGIHYVTQTNDAGMVVFTIPGDGLEEGELLITASKHNCIPYLPPDPVPVRTGNINLVLEDAGFDDEDNGDDNDDHFRNGEEVVLILTLTNTGDQDAEGVSATLSCDSEWLSFSREGIEFGDIDSDETTTYQGDQVIMTLDMDCPDRSLLRIQADINIDEETITSVAFEITTYGPKLFTAPHLIDVDEGFVGGGENASFSPTIQNLGRTGISTFTAELVSLNELITVTEAERNYGAIEPWLDPEEDPDEQSPNEPFIIDFDELFVAGNEARFELRISAEDDYDTTMIISKFVPSREAGEPIGPDDYGYICFDSQDEDWFESPFYYWYEINSDVEDHEFQGTKLDFQPDANARWNDAEVVELPFTFQYYGDDFDNITICTNGFITIGDVDTFFYSPNNHQIPDYAAPDGQLCILWQDISCVRPLYTGVYYYYIEEEGVFVVEWSNVQIWSSDGVHNVTFQILLFDPELYPTATGDGEIVFQYQQFQAIEGADYPRYSTIGIRNLDGSGGLQYAFWNHYVDQANPIENEFAIKFTTATENEYGSVVGRVVRLEDENAGLESVRISSLRFSSVFSDEDGYFRIRNLRTSRFNDVRVLKEGFNTRFIEFDIAPDEETNVGNVTLAHPEFSVETSPEEADTLYLRPDGTQLHLRVNIENDGNGALDYQIGIVNHDGSDLDYDNVQNIGLPQVLNEPRCYGAVYVDSLFYIPGTNRHINNNEGGHLIYVINQAGEFVRSFEQPMAEIDSSANGFNNLAWDGEYLWGVVKDYTGEERGHLFRFDLDGNENLRIVNPFDRYMGLSIAINPETGNLYLADQGTGVVEFEIDSCNNLNEVNRFSIHRPSLEVRIVGIGWNEYDPDGMKLYLLEKQMPVEGESIPMLLKMNHETGEWREANQLYYTRDAPAHRGMAIIHNLSYERSMIAIVEDFGGGRMDTARDSLRIYEIGPNLSFLTDGGISNRLGTINAGEQGQAGLLMDVNGWTEYSSVSFGIRIDHNAAEEAAIIPIVLNVDPTTFGSKNNASKPTDFGITSVYPNPFNSVVRIEFYIDAAMPTALKIFDLTGREVKTLYEGLPEVGYHQLIWDGAKTASGVYFLKLESEGRVKTVKMAIVK